MATTQDMAANLVCVCKCERMCVCICVCMRECVCVRMCECELMCGCLRVCFFCHRIQAFARETLGESLLYTGTLQMTGSR